ncbi:MAG: xanthan lyase [Prevotellaceae bacterium]|nr:xanthan lyase [Prevotellaceae bacterium]
MRTIFFKAFWAFVILLISVNVDAQTDSLRIKIGDKLTAISKTYTDVGNLRVRKIMTDNKSRRIIIEVSESLSYVPFRPDNVEEMYDAVKPLFSESQQKYKFIIRSNGMSIEDLIPNFYRKKNFDKYRRFKRDADEQLVTNISKPYKISHGLQNRHIAMWQSHGWYYEQKLARWEWQRSRIFQTVEDLFTQSFVLPYLTPMLENAGANVLLPRERDIQINEIIVDNDGNRSLSKYVEKNNKEIWETPVDSGFAHIKDFYIENENPFRMGTYRQIETVRDEDDESYAEWIPDIPENGYYAVYISYKTLENSSDNATYTVFHKGGETKFTVNQTMGGGTWIYLGTFAFDKGCNDNFGVRLSNVAKRRNKIITADAVKFGGGMGNVARRPNPEGLERSNTKSSEVKSDTVKIIPTIDYEYVISGYPRFTEGARYWMQWSGIPDSVYNRTENQNDYIDDYSSRGNWVNYIAGGSSVLEKCQGLNIPVDLSLAFHSDAGTTKNDSIIGTLGIFMTKHNNEKFQNGVSRYASRDLTDLIMTDIVNDVRTVFNDTTWTRRGLWNKSYSEARIPEVPAMLLELLSHQNLADMRYGLDPRFRFVVSRAIYKGMLKFIANQNDFEYVVQPLPVEQFSAEFVSDSEVELKWKHVEDKCEPTAKPEQYLIYTRIDDGAFDNGSLVDDESCIMDIVSGKIYSFKIAAVNKGGESFHSEILSVYKSPNEKEKVLIVNAFDRLSAPASFQVDTVIGGFVDRFDYGVPDRVDISYTGSQYEYRRDIEWSNNDSPGFGASHAAYETKVIAGNSFDYPFIHGMAIAEKDDFSFVSCSAKAIENGQVDLKNYGIADIILGKQRQTQTGAGKNEPQFKTFPEKLQNAISDYCQHGGNVFVSGAFIATDLWDSGDIVEQDTAFAQQVLHYKWRTGMASTDGRVKGAASALMPKCGNYEFHNILNQQSYVVEAPDGIEPVGNAASTIMRYSENNISAGIAYSNNNYKTCVLGFPFEAIKSYVERADLMQKILEFFTKQENGLNK